MNVLQEYIRRLKEAIEKAYEEANAQGEFAQGFYRGLVYASRLLSEIMDHKLNEDADADQDC